MQKTLTNVVLDCLLAFFLHSADRADYVLRSNLNKVSVKNKKTMEQVLNRSQEQKIAYWLAIADEFQRQSHNSPLNAQSIKPLVLSNSVRLSASLSVGE